MPVVSGAGSIVGALFGYIILPVWAFYLLKDRVRLTGVFDRGLPPAWRPDVWATIRVVERVFGQWVRGQLLLGVTVAVATFAGLTLLSALVDPVFGRYAVLLSIIAGVLELLPIIGPIIAAIPAVLLAATAGLEATIASLVLYTAIQQLENYILVPKIQGDAVQLHPAAVIFALIVGGSLAGLLGAILALPVVAAFRDVVRYLFRRAGPPEEAGSMEDLARDLGIEPPALPPPGPPPPTTTPDAGTPSTA
jgi:predicted PurR-regulated permease PerM